MFFQTINQMITAGTDLSINIRRVNNNLAVAVVPKHSGVKEGDAIVPLILNGTPEELDAGFLQTIGTPVRKAQGILTNLASFEKQAEQAASQGKAAKPVTEKEPKEVREKREKMEKLLKKAEDATTGKRYSEALMWLKQARTLALPGKQQEIDAKMTEVQKKATEGSLFGMEQPPMPTPKPAVRQAAQQPIATPAPQPVSRPQIPQPAMYPEQPQAQPPVPQGIQFHQPVQMPQPRMEGGQWMQAAPSQPLYTPPQEVPGTFDNRDYHRQPQEPELYNFDKEYEDDRELLKEDPYAEYPDFPKECRMTDMAQMELVYC